jgi:1,4-alpha-glucan branching enzyme
MRLLPLEKLGARCTPDGVADFGAFFPWVSDADGTCMMVKVIHERDQFLQDIPPMIFKMEHSVDPRYGDYWSAHIEIEPQSKPHAKSSWGQPGRYVYRYSLDRPQKDPVDWIIDPYAREFGVGKLSAFTMGYEKHEWSEDEGLWRTLKQEELIIYELMINEFGGDISTTIKHLAYLADLGINCIEIMPVSNVANTVDWGFLPIGYYGVDERFGNRRNMQMLIDKAHSNGIAVIIDMVYGHTDSLFPYSYLYRELGYRENPFMGPFAKDYFGESTDFNRELTRDFFFSVNHHWLDTYHVDGFRYDCVPNYWDGPTGQGFSNLVYETYNLVKAKKSEEGYWQRFFDVGNINLIQCAEQLEGPEEILEKTYCSSTWQNQTFDAATEVANRGWENLTNLGHRLGLVGYRQEVTQNGDRIGKTALQYIENHDHLRFVCNFRTISKDSSDLLTEGDRCLWYKVQPYLIAITMAKGIPMLWQGQEFCENYYVPSSGLGRVAMFRPMRWDYFYDHAGKKTILLVRKLLKIRRKPQFIYGDHWFYDDPKSYQSKGVMLFSRRYGDIFSLVALNFGDGDQNVSFQFPLAGRYNEELHGQDNFNVKAGEDRSITIPGNYGRIWSVNGGR